MCDFSLHEYNNRLAKVGDRLVAFHFGSGSMGFIVQGSSTINPCATCTPPGARLHLTDISSAIQKEYGVSAEEEVTFVQTSTEPRTHHDAIQFGNGKIVSLQRLSQGRARVLSLGGELSEELELARRQITVDTMGVILTRTPSLFPDNFGS